MVEPHFIIFLGQSEGDKDRRLQALQKNAFPPELKDLNYTVLHADDKHLTLSMVTEALSCLPTQGAKKRLLLIRMAHKLDRRVLAGIITKFNKSCDTILILDFPETRPQEAFLAETRKAGAEVVVFKEVQAATAFDLGRAIVSGRTEEALKVLLNLLRYRDKAEKILGALFWQWERTFAEKKLESEPYRNGLKAILDADKRLKSTSSAYARESLILETLVVKLSYLAR